MEKVIYKKLPIILYLNVYAFFEKYCFYIAIIIGTYYTLYYIAIDYKYFNNYLIIIIR